MRLMKKDEPVADVEIFHGHIIEVKKVYSKELLPVGVYEENYELGKDSERDGNRLDAWWKNNSIPAERDSVRLGLLCLGVKDTLTLKTLNRGVSLLNQYWLSEDGETVGWKDVNYWDNPFSNDVGMALFNNKPVRENRISGYSPDASLNGSLKKKWVNEGGVYYLVKGGRGNTSEEVFNEVLVSDILRHVGLPDTGYELTDEDSEICCKTRCFTDENTELVPFSQLMTLCQRAYVPFGEKYTELNHVYDICEYLGVGGYREYLNDMLAVDYIVAGTDRHYNNIALLYDTTCDRYRLSPIYDSGTCMWCDRRLSVISPLSDGDIVARPFCNKSTFGYWDRQRQLIEKYPDISRTDLEAALLRYVKTSLGHSDISEKRVKTLAYYCYIRAHNLQQVVGMKGVGNAERITQGDIKDFECKLKDIVISDNGYDYAKATKEREIPDDEWEL